MPTDLVQSYRIDPADLPNEAVIFGSTAVMRELHGQIERILHNDLPVLIRGESGTGKEVVAKFLHVRSNRCEGPFVKVNCSAVPLGLLESELFGCEAGSSAGATRRGLVDLAAGGTLFLDEIGDLEWTLQSKLLHLLQDGHPARSEGRHGRPARVRVICATNSDLEKAVEKHAFRQDLFYRIDVINLRLAPLRERKEDIPQLCEHFLHKLARKFDKAAPPLTPDALHLLRQWNWPGNVRELENWIARVIILGDDRAMGIELSRQVARSAGRPQPRNGHLKEASRQASAAAARATILKVLRANHWNRRKTAEELNLSYRSLLYKLRPAAVPRRRKSHKRLPPEH
ncbi:MAG: sigma 54-interacting transcriptional regulator [Terracidiphilus sp.]